MLTYYVTAHGYGHGARSCDILATLCRECPELCVTVVSGLPRTFFESRLPMERVQLREARFDLGMVQLDSVRVDVSATLEANLDLLSRADDLVARETEALRAEGCRLVAVDIPALPLEAASKLGIPGVAVGNFGWDWIYSAFAAQNRSWNRVIERLRRGYSQASLLLRLPFAEAMEAFPRRQEVGLVARPGKPCRGRLAELTGADPCRRWALVSFTTLELTPSARRRAAATEGWQFFTVQPLDWQEHGFLAVDPSLVAFCDLVASVDVVLSKPGFGILSDAIVNGRPLVYVERSDFLEYPVLERGLKRFLRHHHLPAAELYRGAVGPALEAALGAPEPPERLSSDGAAAAVRSLRQLYCDPAAELP